MADPVRRSWSRDEVQEILRRAGERVDAEDGIRHEELLAAAREAGLDPASVDAAAKELARGETDRQALERLTMAEVARRGRRFRRSTLTWAVVSAVSALAYALLGPAVGTVVPFAIPVILFATFAGFAGVRALTPPEPEHMERDLAREKRLAAREEERRKHREAAEAWARKLQDEIAARRSRSEARRQKALEVEDAIEDGVRAVLSALARAVTQAATAPSPRASEFSRYVERQRTGNVPPARAVRVETSSGGPKVRVEPHEEPEAERSRSEARRRLER